MCPAEPPRPPSPTKGSSFSGLSANDISIPELDRKEAARKKAEIDQRQKLNPQAPDEQGLNASGLPSKQAYYKDKSKPLHTSVITPILESRLWIKILAAGALLLGFLWIKEGVTYVSSGPNWGMKFYGSLMIICTFFFFIKPAHKLWIITKDLDQLEQDRTEQALADALYSHSQLWKYAGFATLGALLFGLASLIGPFLKDMLSLN